MDYTVEKEWINGPSTHHDIEIQLYQDGMAYLDPITLVGGELE